MAQSPSHHRSTKSPRQAFLREWDVHESPNVGAQSVSVALAGMCPPRPRLLRKPVKLV